MRASVGVVDELLKRSYLSALRSEVADIRTSPAVVDTAVGTVVLGTVAHLALADSGTAVARRLRWVVVQHTGSPENGYTSKRRCTKSLVEDLDNAVAVAEDFFCFVEIV